MNKTESRKGDWMQTRYGRKFWPLDPRPSEVFIDDIAAQLSKCCRFAGACTHHYSVAQHSVYVSREVAPQFALHGLMHDAAEAYCGDLIRPIKLVLPEFKERIELPIERAIFRRFDLQWPMDREVKRADDAVMHAESLQLMLPGPCEWRQDQPPADITIERWTPELAEHEFMVRFAELLPMYLADNWRP